MSDSVRPHRRQPTRLPRPWDSPGKSTGVGCHFLLQCMEVKSESEVVQLCLTPSDPMDSSPQGSSIHGIFQARVLEWELNAKRCLFLTSSKKSESLWYKLETNTTIIRKKKKSCLFLLTMLQPSHSLVCASEKPSPFYLEFSSSLHFSWLTYDSGQFKYHLLRGDHFKNHGT